MNANIRITDINGSTPLQLYIKCVSCEGPSKKLPLNIELILQENSGGQGEWEKEAHGRKWLRIRVNHIHFGEDGSGCEHGFGY